MLRTLSAFVALLSALLLGGCGYNDFQRLDESVKSAWSEVWTIGADDPRVLALKAAPGRREAHHAPVREARTVALRARRAADEPTRRSSGSVSASAARRPSRSG